MQDTFNRKESSEKKAIRRYMRMQKEALTMLDVDRCSKRVTEKVINSQAFINAKVIYIYLEYNQEIITHGIMSKAWSMGKKVAIPKIIDGLMDFYYVESFDDVIPGFKGIFEPFKPNLAKDDKVLMIMPGIAFDLHFNRIGYGGGYYDRYLNEHTDTEFIKMALCYDFQIVDKIEPEAHDNRVDMLITPKAFFSSIIA